MNPYQGIAPLTVATSGAGPGVLVTSGATDIHGWWPVPLAAEGNDPRSAANLMAMGEALTDRTNWIGWRVADFIFGGDYIALFRGLVQFGNVWTLDRSWHNGTEVVMQIFGPTGGGTASLDVFAGGGDGGAIRGSGFGGGAGVTGVGGSSGTGVRGTGGSGGGDGVFGQGTAGGAGVTGVGNGSGASLLAHSGPVRADTHIAATTTTPSPGDLWMSNVPVAWGRVTFDGTNPPVLSDGYNIASVVFADPSNVSVVVTLATGMSSGNIAPVVTFYEDDADSFGRVGMLHTSNGTSFSVRYWILNPSGPVVTQGGYTSSVPGVFTFVVFGRY